MWLEVRFVRSTVAQAIEGGVSALLKALLLQLFFNAGSHDFSTSGIVLPLPTGDVRIFMKLEVVIADEAALHALYTCKGSGGLKPCLLCSNIFNFQVDRGIVEGDATGFAQYHTCNESRKLVAHTPGTIRGIVRRLQAASVHLSNAAFGELQTRLGWSHVGGSVVLDQRSLAICEPTQHACYDYMHVFVVNGVFNHHVGHLIAAVKSLADIRYATLDRYVSEWRWPRALDAKVHATAGGPFCAKRAKSSWDAGMFKATASECIGLMPVLAMFFNNVAAQSGNAMLSLHVKVFSLLVEIINTIRATARKVVDPGALATKIDEYLGRYERLYGPESMVPKFHCMHHFPKFIARWGVLPNCWALERKHKAPKRFANEVRNTNSNWEAAVSREVTNRHLAVMRTHIIDCRSACLLEPTYLPPPAMFTIFKDEFGEATERDYYRLSLKCRINAWEKVSTGDVVLVRGEDGRRFVGEVELLASASDGGLSVVFAQLQLWEFVSAATLAWKYRCRGPRCFLDADCILCALVWAGSGAIRTVLVPTHVCVPPA